MMERVYKYVRSQDKFAIDFKLTYKGQRQFTTLMGGVCSIIMFLTILSMFLINFITLLRDPKFEQSASNSYLTYNHNEMIYNMTTN